MGVLGNSDDWAFRGSSFEIQIIRGWVVSGGGRKREDWVGGGGRYPKSVSLI